MPNHASAKKRIRQNEKKNLRNRPIRSRVSSTIRKFRDLASKKTTLKKAQEYFPQVMQEIDKAVSKGVLHKNTASRKISRLSKLLNV